ncbi:TetR/AcrR family transcriptional regulator [Acetobacter senegalensis]|uniref:TetR/AcrR family transcriptional regulator n=1 Tax=Acetobacter senegalensis TaxID=446692 RepID=UPI000777925B|nr:TetR/AcrR family transcriptional regulator [Acetobacter senegalensis]
MITPQTRLDADNNPSLYAGVTRIFTEDTDLTLAPRKWPRQARSRATVNAILEATALLLEEGKSCSTNAIAERAGVGIATLYQYFQGRNEVIAALSRQVRERLVHTVASALVTACRRSLRDGLRSLILAAVQADRKHPLFAVRLDEIEAKLPLETDHHRIMTELCAVVTTFLEHHNVALGRKAQALANDLCVIAGALIDVTRQRTTVIEADQLDRIIGQLMAVIQAEKKLMRE